MAGPVPPVSTEGDRTCLAIFQDGSKKMVGAENRLREIHHLYEGCLGVPPSPAAGSSGVTSGESFRLMQNCRRDYSIIEENEINALEKYRKNGGFEYTTCWHLLYGTIKKTRFLIRFWFFFFPSYPLTPPTTPLQVGRRSASPGKNSVLTCHPGTYYYRGSVPNKSVLIIGLLENRFGRLHLLWLLYGSPKTMEPERSFTVRDKSLRDVRLHPGRPSPLTLSPLEYLRQRTILRMLDRPERRISIRRITSSTPASPSNSIFEKCSPPHISFRCAVKSRTLLCHMGYD